MEVIDLVTWVPLILILLGWLIYLYLTWDHNYWKKRGVPYVEPEHVFGNFKDTILFRKSIAQVHEDIYKKLDGHKYGGLLGLGKPALFVRDPDLIRDVLVKEFSSFHDNEIFIAADVDPIAGRNPFILRGERWKVTRTRLMPAFTSVKLKPLFPLILGVYEEMKKYIIKDETGEFEGRELCSLFTTDVVATCAYGISGNSFQDPKSEFRRMGRAIFSPDGWSAIKMTIMFVAPNIASLLKWRFITKKVEDFFSRISQEVIEFREAKDISRNDYMQHLINIKKKTESEPTDKYPFEMIDVAAAATTFFIDGFETSAGAMTFLLYALAIHPDIQDKLREEVLKVVNEDKGELTYDNMQKMTYFDLVFAESLRLYGPVPFLRKMCIRTTEFDAPSGEGKLRIEKGTPTIIPVYAIHHEPKYYPNPEEFIPERFTEENKKARHAYAYMPFGEGPRTCLGKRFAQMQVKAGVAKILMDFEVVPADRTQIPFVPDPNSAILAAKGGLWFKFSPLNSK